MKKTKQNGFAVLAVLVVFIIGGVTGAAVQNQHNVIHIGK